MGTRAVSVPDGFPFGWGGDGGPPPAVVGLLNSGPGDPGPAHRRADLTPPDILRLAVGLACLERFAAGTADAAGENFDADE